VTFAVRRTPEFERIAALPRRALTTALAAQAAVDLTPVYATRPTARLLPRQAISIVEVSAAWGGLLFLPVGSGKTLVSFLLPTVLDARRTLLIMKGNALAKQKTPHDFSQLRRKWTSPRHPVKVVTLEWMSPERAASFLDEWDPDLIILEEADDFASTENAAVRRLDRFIRAKRDRAEEAGGLEARRKAVAVVALTGTPIRKSLMGVWHIICWCLDVDAPVPLTKTEAHMWALCIDEHDGRRPSPGPLGRTVDDARAWFRQRLLETPGVVAFDGDSCSAPLTIRVRLARECSHVDAVFERFMVEQESPGGISVSEPLSRLLFEGQAGCGLYSYWQPPPPKYWLAARRAFARLARDRIEDSQRSARPIDTDKQVVRRFGSDPIVREWMRVRGDFDDLKNRRVAWFSRATLDSCHDWLRALDMPGIVFCGSVDFARALSREARLPYYGAQGLTDDGSSIVHAKPGRSIIASWQANKKGLNLQPWPRMLIVMPPQSAKWLEQIIGRVHRQGQFEHVVVDLLATCGGTLDIFEKALAEARFARGIVALTQKVLRADIVRAEPRVTDANAFRWARRVKEAA
jgi:hypothetical protein